MENQHQLIEGYCDLSQEEINIMNEIKREYLGVLDMLRHINARVDSVDKRCVAIAITELETSSMWAVRAIAKPAI
jgi:hypothetical protein